MYNISYIYINMCVCACVRKSVYHIFMGKSKMEPQGCPFQRGKTTCKSAIGRASFRSNCMGCIQVAASTRAVLAKS